MKKAIVSVTNDLVTDRRLDKNCQALIKSGYEVMLVGRKRKNSLALKKRNYKTHRMHLLFDKGPLFYAEYNIRLFLFLLFRKADLLFSNDLDTLLPNYLVSKIKQIPIVYDSHEYFTEVPELTGRKIVKKIWESIEYLIFPKLKRVITVCNSIAKIYKEKYGNEVIVVRNIPPTRLASNDLKTKEELGIPSDKKIIILQGAGINIHRGAEEMLEAMREIKNAVLLIVGGGDVIDILKEKAKNPDLKEKVLFFPKQAFDQLHHFTNHADLGICFNKDTNLNYRYSLPNKLFEYIHAGVPVLASSLPEIKNIIDKYNVGRCIENHSPENIANTINAIFIEKTQLHKWKKNTQMAKEELNWENEEKKLLACFEF